MFITQLKSLSEIQKNLSDSKNLVVLDFFATWCPPCRAIAPKIDKIAEEYKNVSFYKINVDEAEDAAKFYVITAMPTFLFFKNGKLIDTVVGANFPKLSKLVAEHA